MRLTFLFFCVGLFASLPVCGQCPDKDLLWKKLIFLSENSSVERTPEQLNEQVKELSGFEKKMKNCSYRYDSTHAFLLQRTGSVYYKQGEFLKAILVTRQSIDMITGNAFRPFVNTKNLIKDYYNLSVYYSSLNRVAEKMAAIDSCVTIAIRSKYIDPISLYALVQEVNYLSEVGDYERCILYATLGENITAQYSSGADSVEFVINFLVLKINALINYRNYDLAEKLLSRKVDEYKKIGALQHLGTIYELLAEVFISHGNIKKSLSHFQQALKFDESRGFKQGCMQTLNNLGYVYYFQHFHDAKKALYTFKKALTYAGKEERKDAAVRLEMLNILKNIGKVYAYSGKYDSAFFYFQLAFDEVSPGTNEYGFINNFESFVLNKEIMYLAGLVIDKGDAFFQKYKKTGEARLIGEAIRIYKVADRLLYRVKSEQSEMQSRLFWRSNSRRLYEHAIDACYQANNMEEAFYFLEKSRAVLLNDQLDEQRLLGENNMLKLAQFKKKILSLETELRDTAVTPKRDAEIHKDLFINKEELDRLLGVIKSRNPLYFHNQLDTAFITIGQLRNELAANQQAMVELFAGDSAVYTMIVTTKEIHFYKINKGEFDTLTNVYISYISNAALLNSRFDAFIKTSRKLYQLIFPENILPAGRIIISPDGRYFPFEALVKSKQGQATSYFLADHAISYSYSARYLVNHFTAVPGTVARSFLGIAPLEYPERFRLAVLAGSDLSLNSLKEYFPGGDMLLSAKASKNNFLKNFYKYKIIQLYTHSSDSGSNGEPVIYFADSVLHLSELIPANSPVTDLIVLSACETAKGKVHMGEGVFSFSRGFAAMGVPASITNLWSVDNQATYQLTELFYKYFAAGIPSDIALQKAKLAFIETASKEKELPFFWAAPILVGKAKAIDLKKTYTWKTFAVFIFIAALTLWGLKSIVRKKPL